MRYPCASESGAIKSRTKNWKIIHHDMHTSRRLIDFGNVVMFAVYRAVGPYVALMFG
jgi:hypothetical protein